MDSTPFPNNWESMSLVLGRTCNTQIVDDFFDGKRMKEAYAFAFQTYAAWCINQVEKHPHLEGPRLVRRLFGWVEEKDPTLKTVTNVSNMFDERFFSALDPSASLFCRHALTGEFKPKPLGTGFVPAPAGDQNNDRKIEKMDMCDSDAKKNTDATTIKPSSKKNLLSRVRRHSHAKPCSDIKDLATHIRSIGTKGHPAKALHSGHCGVCKLFQDCGNKKGIIPPTLYKVIEMAHLGNSNNLRKLCKRIMQRQKHPVPADSLLPSIRTEIPKRKAIQPRSQVVKLPRIQETDDGRPPPKPHNVKAFQVVNGVYTFIESEEVMDMIRSQDLSCAS
jgi:hypothetical protein